MKQTSTQRVRVPFKMCLVLFLTICSLLSSTTTKAHNVFYYTPPCFMEGTTATMVVRIGNAATGSYFHWQFRVPGGNWTYLMNTSTNSINGRNFKATNASFLSNTSYPGFPGSFLAPALTIENVGSPAYTTQLNGVQFRVLMTDGQDPATNPNVSIWGGEEYLNAYEAKYITLWARSSAAAPCYTVCVGNRLTTDPGNVSPALDTYFGGFEMGGVANSDNFSAPGATSCVTSKAWTDLGLWSTVKAHATAPPNNTYRILNNPDSMWQSFAGFAPRSGRQMMVVHSADASDRIWYRTIATNGTNYFQGNMNISFYVAKVNSTNPVVSVEVRGATAINGGPTCNFSNIAGGSTTLTMTDAMGNQWQKVTFNFNVPVHTYKKLQFVIKTTNNNVSLALDDICLTEPASGLLPIIMTPLKGVYSNGVSRLTWSTLQESNSSHFDVERSTDGVNYEVIGKVAAKGTSDRQSDYSFNDVKVNAGTNYYRLRAIDKDAGFKHSNIVVLEAKIKGTNITSIYPNPFMEKLNVAVSSETTEQAVIRVFDNNGKLVASQQNTVVKGLNNISINNVAGLAKGLYMIRVQIGDQVITQKLIK